MIFVFSPPLLPLQTKVETGNICVFFPHPYHGKTQKHVIHACCVPWPQEGNLGAPVLFAAQDGALPETHRQELLEAIF